MRRVQTKNMNGASYCCEASMPVKVAELRSNKKRSIDNGKGLDNKLKNLVSALKHSKDASMNGASYCCESSMPVKVAELRSNKKRSIDNGKGLDNKLKNLVDARTNVLKNSQKKSNG